MQPLNDSELEEKNFIQNQNPKDWGPMWLWGGICAALLLLVWGLSGVVGDSSPYDDTEAPFFKVTNREFSLFLWQNPEFMRRHVGRKTGYLTGFLRTGRQGMIPAEADKMVVAPPEVVFRYQVWHRLISDVRFERAIPPDQYRQFLRDEPAWLPENWAGAPESYAQTVRLLKTYDDLSELSDEELPWQARQAFIGWKNYFLEGDAVNGVTVGVQELQEFLQEYPMYSRSYWRNVVMDSVPEYLSVTLDVASSDGVVPQNQLTPFLRVALYNREHAGE